MEGLRFRRARSRRAAASMPGIVGSEEMIVAQCPEAQPALGIADEAVGAPFRLLWVAAFLGYVGIGATIQVMPAYVEDRFAGSAFAAGLAVTVGFLATMLARPIAGRLADGGGPRRIVLAGALIAAFGGLGHLAAPSLPWLVVARLLLGLGEGALFTASIGWVLATTPMRSRGSIAGRFGLSMWSGLTIGPILGAALLGTAGFQAVWLTAALLPGFGFMIVSLARPPQRPASARRTEARAWLPRAAWRPGLSYLFASIGYGVVASSLVPRFAGLALPGQNIALAAFGVAFLVTRFAGSPLVDRFGAAAVLPIALVIQAAGLAGLALVGSETTALAMTVVAGIGIALIYPCYIALVTDSAEAGERTAALGLVISAWDLGVAIGGPLGGLLSARSYAGAFLVAGLAALVALAILQARRRSGRG